MPKTIRKITDPKGNGVCVMEIDDRKGHSTYFVRGSQSKFVRTITLTGFTAFPPGLHLNKSGYGFGRKGYFLLEALRSQTNQRKSMDLVIKERGNPEFRELRKKTRVAIPFRDACGLLETLSKMNRDHNAEIRREVAAFLTSIFKRKMHISTEKYGIFHPGELAAVLHRKEINGRMNEADLKAFIDFFSTSFRAKVKGKRGLIKSYRIKFAKDSRHLTEAVYLAEVIEEFESKINKQSTREEEWQVFLRERVFPFLTGYRDIISRQNIGVDESYPDFVLLDVYGFADVFEIKTHKTPLLTYDSAHGNYFWRSEIAEAISQLENYLDILFLNHPEYIRKLRRKAIQVKVIRPRGYIIAGNSKTFRGADGEKMEQDFRRLGKSLKNIEFILYDELLANLKSIKSKLSK